MKKAPLPPCQKTTSLLRKASPAAREPAPRTLGEPLVRTALSTQGSGILTDAELPELRPRGLAPPAGGRPALGGQQRGRAPGTALDASPS
ncbi:hypothetical protein NDU88_002730 [Pleurodeles waltl]|uniref:Uncharacterized protein n=1 Tax=Pleurodeles waltl TaxID=8319 RepID=A0AAV7M395_PLEWA|nr:hypothetical protein NDU88_002730 [Pleurodeles waltl]